MEFFGYFRLRRGAFGIALLLKIRNFKIERMNTFSRVRPLHFDLGQIEHDLSLDNLKIALDRHHRIVI